MRANFTKFEHEFLKEIDDVLSQNTVTPSLEHRKVNDSASKVGKAMFSKLVPNMGNLFGTTTPTLTETQQDENKSELKADETENGSPQKNDAAAEGERNEVAEKAKEAAADVGNIVGKVLDGRLSIFSGGDRDNDSVSPLPGEGTKRKAPLTK